MIDKDTIFNSTDESFGFRLLSVDNNLILPIRTMIRILVTSMDVIHS